MLKLSLSPIIFLLLSACGKAPAAHDNDSSKIVIKTDRFAVNLKLIDFNSAQESKIHEAAELITKVVTSDKFRMGILNHEFEGQKSFADNHGLSNEEIYQKILAGSEELAPGIDEEMDLVLLTYHEDAITIGYTYPNTRNVWMNRKYLDRYGPVEVTGNMMHEWLHKLGFGHELKHSSKRRYSVPYAVGYLMQKLAREIAEK